LIVAATLAFVGAALTVGALFPEYWHTPPLALVDQTGPLAQTVVFAAALLVAGALLLGARSAPIGTAMLVVVVAVGIEPRVADAVRLSDSSGPRAGTGFALVSAGFVLALVSVVIGSIITLRPRAWALHGGARPLAGLAVLVGFGAAVGYGMNPYEVSARRVSIAFGSPLDPLPRQLWAALLVVVVLTVVPAAAVAVGARLGMGLALGLLFAIGGIAALRVGNIYGTIDGHDTGYGGAEGTWTFLAAGGAALIMTFAGLAAGAGRSTPRSAAPAPPAADAPTEPAVELPAPPPSPDEPEAEVEAPRAQPMRSAPATASTPDSPNEEPPPNE
jgi:hypothetical protein